MKVENLKIFLVTAQSASIRRAAELLFVSPQNLSFIIRGLEQELQVTLFTRTHRGLLLTPDGERFVSCAQTMLAAFEDFLAQSQAQPRSCILNFYTTPALAMHLSSLQDCVFADTYYLSIHKRNLEEIQSMLDAWQPGIYFYTIRSGQKLVAGKGKGQQILFRDEYSVRLCHRSNELLEHRQGWEQEMAQRIKILNTFNSDILYPDAINIDDIAICKKLMQEKGMILIITDHLRRANFPEDEFPVLQRIAVEPIDYALLVNLPKTAAMALAQEQLVQRLQALFSA